ncbi:glycosyltransferase family 2 protein [Butyrivibrio sp. AE3004]|uniref:glycosyltransferase family 2 protein n=1 Tax=Butyrivibrio sp. AE3004 TaxID=1506994 RepID=UPI0004946FCD|nr:glycosyltransferase family 2 protein [Butyrivibrio sp. AE3004]
MAAHTIEKERESAESFILRAGEFEQQGSSIDEYAVLIEGLRAHYDNYELYFMLGLYYRYRNPDLAFLCLENALHYCDETEDEKIIREAQNGLRDRTGVRGTSIVIVSYNDLELCKECLYSIRRYCADEAYEIIVVDNASTDSEVIRFLREQADLDSHIKLIQNEKNEGFPAGCNKGLAAANPENDIFFLNNDAVLLPNALFWLKMGLYSDRRNGAAGAVTNSAPSQEVSTESIEPYLSRVKVGGARPLTDISANVIPATGKQKMPHNKMFNGTSGDKTTSEGDRFFETGDAKGMIFEHRWWRTISLDAALETAKSYAKDHNVPMWNPIEVRCRLTGFAVLVRREAINGLLIPHNDKELHSADYMLFDERFTPGYFEDDDLGIRLCLAGWRQVLCHNAFIYHHGGSGFGDKNDAMERSREKFIEKWGFDMWNYTLPEDEKITALLDAIIQKEETNNADTGNTCNDAGVSEKTRKKSDEADDGTIKNTSGEKLHQNTDLKLYDKVLRILDISAGMGNTLSAIKYQMPGSFTAGITNVDVFAGLSQYMADDMISGDPELVTFPWPEHSFDYILTGDALINATDSEKLFNKLEFYLAKNGCIL